MSMSTIYKRFGTVVRKYRKIKKCSTQELAATLDVSTGLISNIENAKNDVFKLEILENLIRFLDIPIDDLTGIFPATIDSIKSSSKGNDIVIHIDDYFDGNIDLLTNSIRNILNTLFAVSKEFDNQAIIYKMLIPHLTHELETLRSVRNIK